MIKRIIDISEKAYVYMKHKQLLIERDKELVGSIPIEDLGAVILQHHAIVITQAVIIACQKNNVILIFCDRQHLPYSVILPISDANSLHTRILQQQIKIAEPTRKRLWKQIVQFKISEQALTLKLLNKNSLPLERLARQVKGGDKENHEAQAAQKYWKLLMGNDFRRRVDSGGVNALLNYGYSIVRAMIARAIVGSGLHPALGLHHHNQYNGLCLADDLMEPFRPWVDYCVYKMIENNQELLIDKDSKGILLKIPSDNVIWKEKTLPLMVACHHLTATLKRAYENKQEKLIYPQLTSRMQKLL